MPSAALYRRLLTMFSFGSYYDDISMERPRPGPAARSPSWKKRWKARSSLGEHAAVLKAMLGRIDRLNADIDQLSQVIEAHIAAVPGGNLTSGRASCPATEQAICAANWRPGHGNRNPVPG
jgi:hypothetical protein